jgi:CRISPR/Cas system-associated exonuclease Cas4 (RecB family)
MERRMSKITKAMFFDTVYCPTYGWLNKSKGAEESSLIDKLRMEEGIEIHQMARELFPDGLLISGNNTTSSQATKKFLNNDEVSFIFEGTFIDGDYITKADILERSDDKWNLYEVKSSKNKKSDQIDDLAYTYSVLIRAGVKIDRCYLLLVSDDYRFGMSVEDLFEQHDSTDKVELKSIEFKKDFKQVSRTLSKIRKPAPELKYECKKCEYYNDCHDSDTKGTIFELPYINLTMFDDLISADIFRIEDIPLSYNLSDYQQKVVKAATTGKIVAYKKGLKDSLNEIVYPAYYFDFETMMTCLPLYKGISPYTQVPTQYSIHVCSDVGKVTKHYEYLADHTKDCRKELAKRLIKDCGKNGSVIVYYASFEVGRIKSMIEWFPDLANDLELILDRIVDLHEIVRDNFYHPDFRGSTSIKRTLPVLVPGMSYEGMNVSDGSEAMAVFAYMAKGYYEKEELKQIRQDLLEYCKLDTLAMVKLHEKLKQLI